MQMNMFNVDKKIPKRYRIYGPKNFSDCSGNGYDKFKPENHLADNNVIEHLIRYGEMLNWYQIVDTRNEMKVIREKYPEDDF